MAESSEVAVGRWVQYDVPKPPGPTTRATGQITDISTTGKLTAGAEVVEAKAGDPAVKVRVWARSEDDEYSKTDRYVVKPASALRMIQQPESIEKAIALNASVQEALRNKVEEHNEKYGSNPSKRATYRMLAAAMRRGIGAYKTNPGSVRPNVRSPEQWGYGRVNGLLHALRTGRFKRTRFDTDLLPKAHPLSTKKELDLTPPKDVQEAAARGLRLRREHGRGGTAIGVARARDLSNGKEVSPRTIKRMVSYFARHAVDLTADKNKNPDAPGYPGAGLIAWLLWGGNPGKRWANHMNDRLAMKQEDISEDLYETAAEATFRAQEIGCAGFHTHEVNGETLYMPCDRMEDYTRLTDMEHTSEDDTTLVNTEALKMCGHWPESPKAVFVAESPNKIEDIRGEPLVGIDGVTFRERYLDRLSLARKDVALTFVYPEKDVESSDSINDLIEQLAFIPSVPVIALGKKAAKALGSFATYTLPHPRAVRIKGDRGEIERKAKAIRKDVSSSQVTKAAVGQCPIIKTDKAAQIVYGVVLEPDTVDLQGDVLELDTIERAAHSYLIRSRVVGDSHSRHATAEVVESYLAPADMKLGGQDIRKGTWIMAVHVKDPELWTRVESGEFNGFSIGGVGERREIEA
jgi:hypothetical protein